MLSRGRFGILVSLVQNDFECRERLAKSGELFDGYNPEMEAIHVQNAQEFQTLLDKYGWPDRNIDGASAQDAAWYIVMHAISLPEFQRRALKILEQKPSSCESRQLAMLQDRILVFSGKKQIYGTQSDWDQNGELKPYPIEHSKQVDELRISVGLPPLETSIRSLRERALSEGEIAPSNPKERIQKRISWMLKTGWIQSFEDVDPAYYS